MLTDAKIAAIDRQPRRPARRAVRNGRGARPAAKGRPVTRAAKATKLARGREFPVSKATNDAANVIGSGKGPITQALEQASVNARERHEKEVRDKLVEYHGKLYSGAAAYDNGVILAGYVAFFTLWAGVDEDVSHLCRLVTVALMSSSLLLYMGWHILQMLTRQTYEFKFAHIFKSATDNPQRFNREWAETAQKQDIATARLMRIWPFVFVPAVVLGFAGGITLSYNAIAVILRWPQLAN